MRTDSADAKLGYGGFVRGGMQLALPMAALREVLPCSALSPLPSPAPGLCGGMDMRGVLLPVLDLARLLGLPQPQPAAAPVVVVLVHDGHVLGLLADDVSGVFLADEQGLHPMHAAAGATDAAGAAAVLQGCVRRSDNAQLVNVLSPQALHALPLLPWLRDPQPQRVLVVSASPTPAADTDTDTDTDTDALARALPDPQAADSGPAVKLADGAASAPPRAADDADQAPVMLMRCGRVALALDALAVHATLASPRLQRSVLSLHADADAAGACLGVIDYGGFQVPALDLLSLLGLGPHQPDDCQQAFVLKLPQGLVALLISEVVDVVRTGAGDCIALPTLGLPQAALLAAALPSDRLVPEAVPRARTLGSHYLVLDAQALRDAPAVRALAAVNVDGAAAEQTQNTSFLVSGAAVGGRPMLIYDLGGPVATPIEEVSEILPFSADMAGYQHTGPLLGLVVVRGRAIPVLCLSGLCGLPAPAVSPAVSVLVVETDGQLLGFAVPRMLTIESSDWQPSLPTGTEHRHDALQRVLHSRQMAQVGHGSDQRLLRVMRLQQVALAWRAQHQPAQALAA